MRDLVGVPRAGLVAHGAELTETHEAGARTHIRVTLKMGLVAKGVGSAGLDEGEYIYAFCGCERQAMRLDGLNECLLEHAPSNTWTCQPQHATQQKAVHQ